MLKHILRLEKPDIMHSKASVAELEKTLDKVAVSRTCMRQTLSQTRVRLGSRTAPGTANSRFKNRCRTSMLYQTHNQLERVKERRV